MLSYPDIFNFLMFYSSELGCKDLSDYKIVKHTVAINQDGFNLCNAIIFQEVNTVSSRENEGSIKEISVNKGSIPQTLDNTWKYNKNKDLPLHVYGWYGRNK